MADSSPFSIMPWRAVRAQGGMLAGIDRIFYAASATQSFASDSDRLAFRARWLGRYLDMGEPWCWVALSPEGQAIGYVAGDIRDPAGEPAYADLSYFADFSDLTARYPAHFHVNLLPAWRGRSIGAALAGRFLDAARARGVSGVHVVTGAAARNRSFYARLGFVALREHAVGGKRLVFLAKDLG